jgi:hypothetical protein
VERTPRPTSHTGGLGPPRRLASIPLTGVADAGSRSARTRVRCQRRGPRRLTAVRANTCESEFWPHDVQDPAIQARTQTALTGRADGKRRIRPASEAVLSQVGILKSPVATAGADAAVKILKRSTQRG